MHAEHAYELYGLTQDSAPTLGKNTCAAELFSVLRALRLPHALHGCNNCIRTSFSRTDSLRFGSTTVHWLCCGQWTTGKESAREWHISRSSTWTQVWSRGKQVFFSSRRVLGRLLPKELWLIRKFLTIHSFYNFSPAAFPCSRGTRWRNVDVITLDTRFQRTPNLRSILTVSWEVRASCFHSLPLKGECVYWRHQHLALNKTFGFTLWAPRPPHGMAYNKCAPGHC